MGKRAELLSKLVMEKSCSPETRAILFALREILHVQEEVLAEIQAQGLDEEEKAWRRSMPDR